MANLIGGKRGADSALEVVENILPSEIWSRNYSGPLSFALLLMKFDEGKGIMHERNGNSTLKSHCNYFYQKCIHFCCVNKNFFSSLNEHY